MPSALEGQSLTRWITREVLDITILKTRITLKSKCAKCVTSQTAQPVKNLPSMQDTQEIPVLFLDQEASSGGGNGNPLQCSCPENPVDSGAWQLQSMGHHRVRHD